MTLTRRGFVKAGGFGGMAALTAPVIGARGYESALWAEREIEARFGDRGPLVSEAVAEYRRLAARAMRLDSNENPNGPGKAALDAVKRVFDEASRYPDVPSEQTLPAVARYASVAPENVLLGCGSTEILRMAVFAFCGPDRGLVTAAPAYEDPVRQAELIRAPVRAIPVDAWLRADLSAMADAVSGAGMVFLCSPNNPTATIVTMSDLKGFVSAVHRRAPQCVVLVDEAYFEFVEDPSYASAVPLALENPNVIVVRTFSKVFGMAGMRLGYAVGQPATLRRMAAHRLGSNVNVFVAAAAAATLGDMNHLRREVEQNRQAREFTLAAFESMGHRAEASHANFILVPLGRESRWFRDECAKRGVLVGRPFPPLTKHTRVSIGTMDEMKKAVGVFKAVLSGGA